MKLTDQHISAERIIAAIEWIDTPMWLRKTELQTDDVKSALLDVLQRRAEDRQRGTIDWTKNTVHHLQMDE